MLECFDDVVLVVVSYFHTAGFPVAVLCVAKVLLAYFLRLNANFGECGWGVVIVVGGDAWDDLQGRVVDGGSRSGEAQRLILAASSSVDVSGDGAGRFAAGVGIGWERWFVG